MELAIQRVLNKVNRPTGSGEMAVGAKVICKLKLWTAAILNLCTLTTFPVSKSWRLFICWSKGSNKQVKAQKPSIAICSKSSPTLTGLKERRRLTVSADWTFFASSHSWGAMSVYWSNCGYWNGVGHIEHKFQGEGGHPPTTVGIKNHRVPGLSRGVVYMFLRLSVLIQYWRVTDRHTHKHTDTRQRLIPTHS